MERVRLIIADPLELIAEGVRSWLRDEVAYEVIGHARTGQELMEVLSAQACEVVLLEVSLPGMDGIDTMRAVKHRFPRQKVLAFSALTGIEYVNSMLIEGAAGYLVKDGQRDELLKALKDVMKGQQYLSVAALRSVEQGYSYTSKRPDGKYIGLTDREREIIRLIALERTNAEMSASLFLSEDTVKAHRKHLMTKLNVRSAAGLVKYALDRRWV